MDIADAVAAPRCITRLPDEVRIEQGFLRTVLAELKEQRHRVTNRRPDLDQFDCW